jgi:hypothetical protein
MEVSPPKLVWEKISINLDEINADNLIAVKLQDSSTLPSPAIWEKIKESFDIHETAVIEKKTLIIPWRKLAAAAIFIGMVISVWLVFFNTQNTKQKIAIQNNSTITNQENKVVSEQKELNKIADQPENNSQEGSSLLVSAKKIVSSNLDNKNKLPSVQKAISVPDTDFKSISLNKDKPGDKTFNQPIDDLSMIAANDNYMTMITTNGRIVKIPAHLTHLVPHLQDKPITEDYYEFMFGEGAYWKEKMNDWRQKLATSPVSSGDLFSNMVELLKSAESGQDNPVGRGR